MDAEGFRKWMDSRRTSRTEGAKLLGVERRLIRRYMLGEVPIPQCIADKCAELDAVACPSLDTEYPGYYVLRVEDNFVMNKHCGPFASMRNAEEELAHMKTLPLCIKCFTYKIVTAHDVETGVIGSRTNSNAVNIDAILEELGI